MTLPVPADTLTQIAALLAVLLPLLAFGLIMVVFRSRRRLCARIAIGAVSISLLCALFLLVTHWHLKAPIEHTTNWMVSGRLTISVGFLLDPISLLMLTIVAAVSFLVQVYSLGYMARDPGFSRYYGFMSLFAWAMMSLVISPNLLQLYIFWELVGLSSYLLIGFWYEKFSASTAGKKAFVMTRLGDVAFFLGILLVLFNLENLDILEMNASSLPLNLPPATITLSAMLIFGGIIGKSAQFPLLTWLPDAMEGPTPVSALLHSATMVAAGVFLFGRLFPFFSHAPGAMTFFLFIGTLSMLLAASMAMVSRDIKQVWAYSTISQLGFMIMGLSAGGYAAGIFHLTTHAGFKALLFLCAGVFIHAFETNDMFAIGRAGGRGLKIPMICMTVAAAALAGIPPFSGFFSKEAIMAQLAQRANPLWLAAGLLGAFLTAYYAFRLIFVILFPRPDETRPAHDAHAGHAENGDERRTYRQMAGPLIVLATVTLVLGWGQAGLEAFLDRGATAVPAAAVLQHAAWLPYTALGMAFAGILLAWLEFGRRRAAQVGFVERMPRVRRLFAERWYLDHFYRALLERVVYGGISALCTRNDRQVIDGALDALGRATVAGSRRLSLLHKAALQARMMVIFAVMAFLSLYFLLT